MSLRGYKFILARGEGNINSTSPLLDAELIEIEKPYEESTSEPTPQVQSDFNQEDDTQPDFIKNKPRHHIYESRPSVDINNPYTIVPEDEDKTLIFYDPITIIIPDGVENMNITKPINGINSSPGNNPSTDHLTFTTATGASLIIPYGYLPKIELGGKFQLNTWYNTMFLTGDLVKDPILNPEISIRRGTVIITTNTILTKELHDQKTLICRNSGADITITVPTGLGTDFDCNVVSEDSGTRYVNIVAGTGMTFKAPHGTKVLTDYTAHIIKRTGEEVCNIQGELTP